MKRKFKGLSSAYLIDLPSVNDERGKLSFIEGGLNIPFDIKRCYFIYDILMPRGGHAHRETYQIIIAASGDFQLQLSDGENSKIFNLNSPSVGLCFDPMLWIEIPKFSADATVLVLASTHYDSKKTIRDWQEYLEAIEQIKLNN
jgi:hypothetical protein